MTKKIFVVWGLLLISVVGFAQDNWIIQDSGTTHDVICVHFIDANVGWIAGGGTPATILSTTNGGNNWSPLISGVEGVELKSIFFTDNDNGWIVGEHGTIIHTTDGGINWEPQNPDTTGVLQSIFFTDVNNGWVVGGEPSIMLRTQDGGNNWIEQTTGTTSDLDGIYFIDLNSGWIVGKNGTILHTSDAGNNWNTQVSGTNRTLKDVHFIDSQKGWIVGGSGEILHTTDGGNNWITQFPMTNSTLKSVFFTDENTGWVVGTEGTIIYTTDGGNNWHLENSGTTVDLKCVFFADAISGWIVGEIGLILNYNSNTGIENDENLESSAIYTLVQNYPNPFNPTTTISFKISNEQNQQNEQVNIEIYNLKGQKVKQLLSDQLSVGQYSVMWNGTDENNNLISSGVYFYQLKVGNGFSETKRMLLLK